MRAAQGTSPGAGGTEGATDRWTGMTTDQGTATVSLAGLVEAVAGAARGVEESPQPRAERRGCGRVSLSGRCAVCSARRAVSYAGDRCARFKGRDLASLLCAISQDVPRFLKATALI